MLGKIRVPSFGMFFDSMGGNFLFFDVFCWSNQQFSTNSLARSASSSTSVTKSSSFATRNCGTLDLSWAKDEPTSRRVCSAQAVLGGKGCMTWVRLCGVYCTVAVCNILFCYLIVCYDICAS